MFLPPQSSRWELRCKQCRRWRYRSNKKRRSATTIHWQKTAKGPEDRVRHRSDFPLQLARMVSGIQRKFR